MIIVLNFILLFFIAIILASFCKNCWLKAVVSLLFSFFLCMQIVSLYIGGSFCDYKFFAHFNFRDFWWGATSFFKVEALFLPIVLIGVSAGMFFLSKLLFLRNKRPFVFIKSGVLGLSLLFLFATKNGIVDGLDEVYIFLFSTSTASNFNDAVKDIETVVRKQNKKFVFTKKEDLTASAEGKNIIIISLESLEQGFLHDKNKHLTPNLRKLKQEWNYFNMFQSGGGGWTVASLYTALTGLPCFFIGHGNRFFEYSQKSKLVSVVDVLNKTGYEMYFLSEDAAFAGTKDLLKTFGVQNILDGTLYGKYPEWMQDMDLFAEAKNIIQTSSQTSPVMIFISTIGTHFPNGRFEPRLFNVVEKGKSDLETAVLQADYLVGDFINFLKQGGYLENTIVYIFPDHLFMGNTTILKTGEKRGLWFLTNADAKDLHIDNANFYQIDLPRNILAGAKIKHNAVFLSDGIKQNKNEFINKNLKSLLALNTFSLERNNVLGNFAVQIRKDSVVCLFNDSTLFTKPIDTLKKYEQIIFLTNELKIQNLTSLKSGTFDTAYLDNYYDIYIKIGIYKDKLNVEWGRDNVLKKEFSSTSKLKMNPVKIDETLTAISLKNVKVKRVEKMPKDTLLLDYLQQTLQDSSKIIIMSCLDEASVHFSKLNPILEQVGLKESISDCYRCSYIAVFSQNKIYFNKNGHQKAIHKKLNIDDVSFYISSGGYENPTSKIVINDEDYSYNTRGLNFVIFNAKTNCIEDAFNVDFHGDETLKINRH